MSIIAIERSPIATGVTFTADEMLVALADGRRLAVPLVWFPRLAKATSDQLKAYELLGAGEGIHWPQLDEDLSVAGLLRP